MSTLRASVEVRFPLESEELAETVRRALAVEADGAPPGCRFHVAREGPALVVRIESPDMGGLRAGVNSYLRWTDTALAVARLARKGRP